MPGLFGSLVSGLRRGEVRVADASALAGLFSQPNARSGVSVTIDSALKVSTVFACLRVLADGIAQVPLKVYREKADGTKELAKDHPAYRLLSRRPNEWMTSFEFRQVMMFHAALLGNGCAYIGRVRGVPRELIPLVPGSYTIEQASDYTLSYRLTDLAGHTTILPREDVFHLRGPSWTGRAGLDALQIAREAVGLAIATEETHAALHANGTQPGGVLSVKGSLDDAARARLKEAWAQYQGGLHNRFKTAVLDMESTWTPLAMKGVDAEHLDTRRFQIEEICRDLKVFPQMVGYADKTATFASAEAFFLAHVIHTLAPWIENWEQSLARDLFPDEDDIVAKFSLQGLLRGDNAARAAFYAIIGHFRLYDSGGNCMLQGSVTNTGGGGEMTVDNVNVNQHQQITITAWTFNAGNA